MVVLVRGLIVLSALLIALPTLIASADPVCVICNDGRRFICLDGQLLCGIQNPSCSVADSAVGCPDSGSSCQTTTGGNCQNNAWCNCNCVISKTSPIVPIANQPINFHFEVKDRVGSVDGKFRTVVDAGGEIDWGDGQKTPLGTPDSVDIAHIYKTPGKYTVSARIGGQFHWSAAGGSCSFNCQARGSLAIEVFDSGLRKK